MSGQVSPDRYVVEKWGMTIVGPGFVTLFLLLLVLSMVLTASLRGTVAQPRVRIPYSPTFLTQVENGNVSSIATKGTGVQGKFRQPVQYPDAAASPATEFVTEIPAFANGNQLMAQLQEKGVVINASSPSAGSSVLVTLLFTFGPVFLFVGLFVWLMRRGGGLGGGVTGFGRSRAQRVEPSDQHVNFTPSAIPRGMIDTLRTGSAPGVSIPTIACPAS